MRLLGPSWASPFGPANGGSETVPAVSVALRRFGVVWHGSGGMKSLGSKRVVAAALLVLSTGAAGAGPFDAAVGDWRGQAEYLAKVNAVADDSAHAVVELSVRIEAGGKISGASAENGCRLLGVITSFSSPQVYRSQVTLSQCRAASLNGRYMGPVSVKPQVGTLTLSLQMVEPGARPSRWGTVTATMVRR
jgi:hypothetical protein